MRTDNFLSSKFGQDSFPVILDFYKTKDPQFCRPNYHPEIEIHLVRRGKGNYFVRNANYALGTNSVIIAHKNEVHAYTPDPEPSLMVKLCLIFSASLVIRRPSASAALRRLRSIHHLVLSDKQAIVAEFLLNNIGDECKNKHLNWQDTVIDHIEAILILLHRAADGQSDDRRSDDPVIQEVIKYLEDKFKESPSLTEISDRFGMSRYNLSRKFKQYVGLGFKEYLIHRRIVEAQRMLEEVELKVTTIAHEVGFDSISAFNRSFHMLTGITPAAYRKLSLANRSDEARHVYASVNAFSDTQRSTSQKDS